jgi:RNA recognition motif-containing protein
MWSLRSCQDTFQFRLPTYTELNGRKIFVREDREAGNTVGFQPHHQFQQQRGYQQQYQVADQPAYKSGSFAAQKIRNSTPAENQVYIGNLPWSVKWQDLKDICAKHGEVIRADVQEDAVGRSKGFGTVVFANAHEAESCISELNESELAGRNLIVRLDTRAAAAKVYVGNLPWSASWQDLKDIAKQFGDVQHADIITEPSGRSKGFGIVTFADAAGAEQCIAGLNGQEFQGRTLQVKVDERP